MRWAICWRRSFTDSCSAIVGWRGMFVIGALPAFLVIYIRTKVDESPAWLQGRVSRNAESRLGKDILTYVGTFSFLGGADVCVQFV